MKNFLDRMSVRHIRILIILIAALWCAPLVFAGVAAPCQRVVQFYRTYLAALDAGKDGRTLAAFRALTQQYLTPACIADTWKKKTTQDYDPIVQGQDWSREWRAHLQATLVGTHGTQSTCKVVVDPTWPQIVMVNVDVQQGTLWISKFFPDIAATVK